MRRRRHKVSGKVRFLDNIRRNATSGAFYRLSGDIQKAMSYEREVDRAVAAAERSGYGDQASNAEEAGKRMGGRLHRRGK